MSDTGAGRPLMVPSWLKARLEEFGVAMEKAFDETKHRRYPKGHPKGGKFMPKGGGQGGDNNAQQRPKIRLANGEEVTLADEFEGEKERIEERNRKFQEELQQEEALLQAGNTALPADWDGTIRVTVEGFVMDSAHPEKVSAMASALRERLSARYPNANIDVNPGYAGADVCKLDRAAIRETQDARGIGEDEAFEQRRALDGELLHDMLMIR